jgi:hypothetical protein
MIYNIAGKYVSSSEAAILKVSITAEFLINSGEDSCRIDPTTSGVATALALGNGSGALRYQTNGRHVHE